jgi:hypothetical protein
VIDNETAIDLTQALVIFRREYADGNVGLWSQADLSQQGHSGQLLALRGPSRLVEFQSLRGYLSPINLLI